MNSRLKSDIGQKMIVEQGIDYDKVINLTFLFRMQFQDENQVVHFCMKAGLIANEYACSFCSKKMTLLNNSNSFQWKCRTRTADNRHSYSRSVRVGSWFGNSRLNMNTILQLTYMFVHKCSSHFIMDTLQVGSHTVRDWKCACREVCVQSLIEESEQIGGINAIVEIYENELAQRKYSRGENVNGEWIFMGVERDSAKCFFKVMPNGSRDTLLEVLKENVLPGSTVISDCCSYYDNLEDEDFKQLKVSRELHFRDPDANEGSWGAVKRSLPPNKCQNLMDLYLGEYLWRKKNKDAENLFMVFLDAVKKIYPPPVQDKK